VFGTPSDSGAWGYRVEGHHLSQNYTVVDGKVIDGPSFFGANPAEVRQGPRKGLRTLAGEDDLGIELIHTLDEQQLKVAIVDPTAYEDILTAASRKAIRRTCETRSDVLFATSNVLRLVNRGGRAWQCSLFVAHRGVVERCPVESVPLVFTVRGFSVSGDDNATGSGDFTSLLGG